MLKRVPTQRADYRVAIVTSHRTNYDDVNQAPFSGPLGDDFLDLLRRNNILVNACYMATINDSGIDEPAPTHPDILCNVLELRADLMHWKPNLIVLVGTAAFNLAAPGHSLHHFHGSQFICRDPSSPYNGFKCMGMFGPKDAKRNTEYAAFNIFDTRKIPVLGRVPHIDLPKLELEIELPPQEIINRLDAIKDGDEIAMDIEGGVPRDSGKYRNEQGVKCVGIATSPTKAFIVNPWDYSEENCILILRAFARVMENPRIGKILQNSLYDNFVLCWLWKCHIKNVSWDTLISGWEMFPELPKALETQVALYTLYPYYKDEKTIPDKRTHYTYCLKDATYTYDIALKHRKALKPKALEHVKFNLDLLSPLLYAEIRGINYNKEKADEMLALVRLQIDQTVQAVHTMIGRSINLNSPDQLKKLLYEERGYPKQFKRDYKKGVNVLTTDVDALLTLCRECDKPPLITQILRHRTLESLRKQLEIEPDPDGRVRCAYGILGTDTGRLNCSESPTGSGANLTTIMKKIRLLYKADNEQFDFWELDLSGADGWTVAVECATAGDPTMLEDYRFGLKPAVIIALMYEEFVRETKGLSRAAASRFVSTINQLTRQQIKDLSKQFNTKTWLYDASKAVQHGTNYDMQPPTMSDNLLRQSHKKSGSAVFVAVSDCKLLQGFYNARYEGVKARKKMIDEKLRTTGRITTANGNTRTFFGDRLDKAVRRSAYSHSPQSNTTYACKLALHRLWNDEENWENNRPVVESLHQIHDALAGQYPVSRREWAHKKLREWFQNYITIDDMSLIIPFEGKYGPSWGELKHEI